MSVSVSVEEVEILVHLSRREFLTQKKEELRNGLELKCVCTNKDKVLNLADITNGKLKLNTIFY